MGKQKLKNSSNLQKSSDTAAEIEIPSFDQNALSVLTSRIEERLGKQKLQREQETGAERRIKKLNHKDRNQNKPSNLQKQDPKTKIQEFVKGAKRSADGNVKGCGKSTGKDLSSSQRSNKRDGISSEVLLKEILSLGGTEDDLKLVEDAISDDEKSLAPTEPLVDNALQKELESYISDLGIQAKIQDYEEEETLADGSADEEWENSSESELLSPSEACTKAKPVTGPSTTSSSQANHPNRLIFEPRSDWHAAPLPALQTHTVENQEIFTKSISSLKEYAMSLLEADSQLYASKHLSASSSHRFLSTVMTSGTLSDKVSALTLVVQESPVHTTKSFESLLALAKKRSRGQAVTALAALKDLLGTGAVLPADRRLRNFASQPGLLATLSEDSVVSWKLGQRLPGMISQSHLISWSYEDWLKQSYFEMLKILESWCNDEIEYARSRVVTYVYELLRDKPEQEANLLRLLVNKLGDPDKKISSRTSYLILQLQISHPLMKPIIIRSIETELLLRPGQNIHAKYYAINTLNQTILSVKEEDVAKTLIRIYFGLFVSLLKRPEVLKTSNKSGPAPVVNRKGEIQGGGGPIGKKAKAKLTQQQESKLANEELNEKMISAVLTGVNRAFPFLKSEDFSLEDHMDTLFKITHSSNFNTSIQALMLIEQLATTKNLSVDRFYRKLYESLLDPRLVTSSKHALYLNLLFRSLRSDNDIKRVKAFVKRMMQIITLHQPPFICGILYLIKEIETKFPGLKSLRIDPEEDGADDEVFLDVPEEDSSHIERPDRDLDLRTRYDGRKRDPLYSNAQNSCLWELIPFLAHFHPSVSLFATRLLNDESMPPKPDLASHTLSSFLDKFVYRNAKAVSKEPRGSSIMQPLAGGDNKGILISNRGVNHAQQPLNCESFWRKKAEDVAVDEVFFHKYYSCIGKSKQHTKKKSGEIETPDYSGENEDEIWEALVKSKPDIEGDDSDMELLDIDDSDSDSVPEDAETDDDIRDETLDIDDAQFVEADISDEGGEITNLFEHELMRGNPDKTENPTAKNNKSRKKRLKSLPTFASVEDYASILDKEEVEDY